jgi:hypothetical protein
VQFDGPSLIANGPYGLTTVNYLFVDACISDLSKFFVSLDWDIIGKSCGFQFLGIIQTIFLEET